jgi:hypothetical protein
MADTLTRLAALGTLSPHGVSWAGEGLVGALPDDVAFGYRRQAGIQN